MSNIQNAINELHKAFYYMNVEFFNGELPEVALTIQSSGKRLSMGWFTPWTAWKDKENNIKMHEINLSAEFLNIPFMETMDTLLHEMIHLYCHMNEIKDTSRGGTFHNKKFKEASEKHGFYYDAPANKKHGWAFSKLKPETKQLIERFDIDRSAFLIAREAEVAKDAKKPKSYKWECPECHDKLRSTKKDVKPICGKHFKRTLFELMNDDEEGEGDE